MRLERVFVDLGIPVPPIVVHDGGSDTPGDTGMVRVARAPNLTDARNYAALVDQRALAFHGAYLDGQRAARGSEFGTLPAERDWSVLSEQFRDDNRSSADHIDYKLARTGFVSGRRDRRGRPDGNRHRDAGGARARALDGAAQPCGLAIMGPYATMHCCCIRT